jgi:uncharacterized membrane protein
MNDNRELDGYHKDDDRAHRHIVSEQTTLVRHQGPLPPPAILKQYDDVVPGAAERIITMAEN